MITNFKTVIDKSFWPLFFLYGLLLMYLLYQYFTAKSVTVDMLFYKQGYAIMMIPVGAVLLVGLIIRPCGFWKVSNWILALPVILAIGYFVITVAIMIFLAVVFILFGKS